jgi:uncharacterized protein (TIGR02001 family)
MTIKKTLIGAASVAALALAVTAAPAAADGYAVESAPAAPASDAREFSWSITIGGTSDYVFRGISQTAGDPAAQGSIDMSYGIFYAGAWGSNIDLDGGATPGFGSAEIDFYAGIKPVLGPVTFDLGVLYYWYPGSDDPVGAETDYVELKAGASFSPFKDATLGAIVYYSPDNFGETGDVFTIEGTAGYTLPAVGIFTPAISGTVGTVLSDTLDLDLAEAGLQDEYVYWNAGLSLTVEKFTMDFRYWDTDLSTANCSADLFGCDERFVFTAKVVLP